jgi:hypothetical protein
VALGLSWLWLAGMLAFLLGTFFHVRLTRDKKGRVKLMKTWRVCFVPRPPTEIALRDYVGVRKGMSRDAGWLEWIICINLIISGLLPGLLFWYKVILTDRHDVVLTRDSGYADVMLYRGTDGSLAEEVTVTLRDAARLREEKA